MAARRAVAKCLSVMIAAGLTVAGLYLLNNRGTQVEKLSATLCITC